MPRKALPLLLFAAAAGCSGAGFPRVLDPADIVDLSEGRPQITRVRDVGNPPLRAAAPLPGAPDGQFTVGELLLIEGRGFGKHPTVQVGGRPAELLYRTAGGGILVRLPAGVGTGLQGVSVQVQSGGRAQAPIEVRRLALLLDRRRGLLHAIEVGGGPGRAPDAHSARQPLRVTGARGVAMDPSGAAAYVLVAGKDQDQVAIVDLGAPGGPAVAEVRGLTHRAYAIVAAERAPAVVMVGQEHLTRWDTIKPLRPSPWRAARLPQEARAGQAAALSPTGDALAIVPPEGNQVLLLSIKPDGQRVQPEVLAQADALPGVKQPILRALRFAPDGETIWALAGESQASQATRLVALAVENQGEGERARRDLAVTRTVDLQEVGQPRALALSRAAPTAAGTIIRTPPEKTGLFVGASGVAGGLFRADAGGAVKALAPSGAEPASVGGLDLTPDAAVVVAALCAPGPQGMQALLAHNEMSTTFTLSLGPADAADAAAIDVAVQP